MGPNHAEIVRVSTRQHGGKISDTTISPKQDIEIVVESECGSALSGAQCEIGVSVIDDSGCNVVTTLAPVAFSALNDRRVDTFMVPRTALAGREKHVCHAVAYLLVGTSAGRQHQEADAAFRNSPNFLLLNR